MSPRAYCALQCAVPAILIILDRRGGSMRVRYIIFLSGEEVAGGEISPLR